MDSRTVAAFLDTNILVHFRSFDELDWRELLDAENVILCVPLIVIAELDQLKDHDTGKKRHRARFLLQRLEELGKPDQRTNLRHGVDLLLIAARPRLDYGEHGLDREVNDDRIIASMIDFRRSNPGLELVLLSDDTTPRISAQRFGLSARSLPEDLREPLAQDPVERELQQLRREAAKLASARPDLTLEFENGEQFLKYQLRPIPAPPGGDESDKLLAIAKEKAPALSHTTTGPLGAALMAVEGERARYDRQREAYWDAMKSYPHRLHSHALIRRRTLAFQVYLVNNGGAPASEIDVHLHIPDGVVVRTPDQLPKPPSEPRAPIRPRTAIELSLQSIHALPRSHLTLPSLPDIGGNVSDPSIRRSNSYDVDFEVNRLRHGRTEQLPDLALTFESDDAIGSFACDYRITSAEMPDSWTGRLHVVVELPTAGSEDGSNGAGPASA